MKISIKLIAGYCNGLFSLRVKNNDDPFEIISLSTGMNVIEIDAKSGKLTLEFAGKDNRRDTRVVDGRITEDKFIDLQCVTVGGFKLERYHLYHHFFDPYVSRDSTLEIFLPDARDLLQWYTRILEKHATVN